MHSREGDARGGGREDEERAQAQARTGKPPPKRAGVQAPTPEIVWCQD